MSSTENTSHEPNAFDQILGETDLGRFIGKYKILLALLLGVIIIGVIGQGLYNNISTKSNNEFSDKIYEFTEGPLTQFKNKKIEAAELSKNYQNLRALTKGAAGIELVTLETANLFKERGLLKESHGLLLDAYQNKGNAYGKFFIALNLAASHENLGENDQAITVLEWLLTQPVKLYQEKIYLDLGRLYKAKGNSEKAKASFQYVIDEGSEAEFKKLAKLYLEDLS